MAPKWLKGLGKTGLAIAGALIPGVAAIEAVAEALPGLSGKQKQDAVVELVKSALLASEGVSEKDLLDDAEVEKAARAVVDATVALMNIVEKKKAQLASHLTP